MITAKEVKALFEQWAGVTLDVCPEDYDSYHFDDEDLIVSYTVNEGFSYSYGSASFPIGWIAMSPEEREPLIADKVYSYRIANLEQKKRKLGDELRRVTVQFENTCDELMKLERERNSLRG